MPFKRKDIEEIFDLKEKLKKAGEISPAVDLLFKSLFTIVHYQFEQIEGLKEENKILKIKVVDGKLVSEFV